jgi:hypothetical protein
MLGKMEYGRITYSSIHLNYHNRRKALIQKHLAQFSSISYRKDYQDFLLGFNSKPRPEHAKPDRRALGVGTLESRYGHRESSRR